jgi:hypothetical protein
MKPISLVSALLLTFASLTHAETVKDREGAVRGEKAKMADDTRWNWNDIDSGFRLAKITGKPLLVVLRCMPCLSCDAKKEGFQKDDILVQIGDLKQRITESAIIGHLLQRHRPGEKLTAIVQRSGKRVELKLPQQ